MTNRKERRRQEKLAQKQLKKTDDTQTSMGMVKAAELQSKIQEAIGQVGITEDDIPLIIQALGLTAAGLALRAGIAHDDFVNGMAGYDKQVRDMVKAALGEPAERNPLVVLS